MASCVYQPVALLDCQFVMGGLFRFEILMNHLVWVARDIAVGIATCYGLDGPGIESPLGRDIPHPSRSALGPTQPPVFPWGQSGRGVSLTTHPPSSTEVKERVSYTSTPPSVPSWPVPGCEHLVCV